MDDEQRQQAIRQQRRAIERRRDEVIREARVMAFGDARKARPDLVQALHDHDEAQRRLAELEAQANPQLPLLPENAGAHEAPHDHDLFDPTGPTRDA